MSYYMRAAQSTHRKEIKVQAYFGVKHLRFMHLRIIQKVYENTYYADSKTCDSIFHDPLEVPSHE